MSEDTTRMVGGNSDRSITIAGKECTLKPLTIREIGELERACVRQYKRHYIETFADNADLLPESRRDQILLEKMEKVATWDVNSLPTTKAYDINKIYVCQKLEEWAKSRYLDYFAAESVEEDSRKKLLQRIVATALDKGDLSPAEYKELTGFDAISEKVGYVNWWITGSFDGMLEMIYVALKSNGVTKDQIAQELSDKPSLMVELARELEHISSPQSGNT